MALSGFLFLSWRIFEIITLIPVVGMLAWFVHQYVRQNLLTPDYILVLFIVSVIALAWAVFTTIDYLRARYDMLFVAFFDLCLVGALIAGVYYLRSIAHANCTSGSAGTTNGGFYISVDTNKQCGMLKASFAFGIIDIIAFFVTFVSSTPHHPTPHTSLILICIQLLALLVHHHHRNNDKVVVKRTYRSSSHSHNSNRQRSRSRDYNNRGSRDYGYDSRPSGSRRSHQSGSRRQYYV